MVRRPFDVPELQVHYEMEFIAEQLIKLQRRQPWSLWCNFEWMSSQWNQIFVMYVGRQQAFLLFQLHTVVKLFFNTNYF